MSENTNPNQFELLTFRVGEQEYSLDIMSVREIRGWTSTTSLPHSPDFMRGVINLRGTVLPVMDLASRLNLPGREVTDRNVIIVVSLDGALTGLLVDAVSDIITLSESDLQAPPEMSADQNHAVIKALTMVDERMIRVLDLAAVIPSGQGEAA